LTDVLLIFGTRPEAIKMAPLVHALKQDEMLKTKVCVTAQHREMLDQVLAAFEIHPEFDLDLMAQGQDLFDVTAQVLINLRSLLKETKPKLVLVHGDTTTSMAAGIACFYLGIPIGHVEAGLRTYDLAAPFPEEFNRRVSGLLAALHFAPTLKSKQNLIDEGVDKDCIVETGNTVVDALKWALQRLEADRELGNAVDSQLGEFLSFDWKQEKFVLITGHRRENFGDGFKEICQAIADLSSKNPDVHFVYPVHLNPNVQEPVNKVLSDKSNVHLIAPLEYLFFVRLMSFSYLVLTDSGGIQEEAPSIGKPVLVMRDVTERPEAIDAGTVKLVGASRTSICDGIQGLLDNPGLYNRMSRAYNPYGDGQACGRIVKRVKEYISCNE
jgi:UDP-N-acetylglucosamine 2-epimerase (non-hydrolysing)